MLLAPIMLVFLLATSVSAAPTNSSSPTVDRSDGDDDPLEVSETGHSRRRRLWRRLLKMGLGGYGLGGYGLGGYGLGGYGLGGYGLGGYGLEGSGLNFLSQLAHFQRQNNYAHHGPHRGPPVYGGVGVGSGGGVYGSNVLHHPVHPVGGYHAGEYYGQPLSFPVNPGLQGGVTPAGLGLWDRGAWGLFGNYGLGGPDGLNYETAWL